jgi:hypothetical protein
MRRDGHIPACFDLSFRSSAMPDTGAYLILGLVAVTVIIGFFVVSLVIRHRNLQRDLELIQKLAEDD